MGYEKTLAVLNKKDDVAYYLLGAFFADGCTYAHPNGGKRTELTSKDVDWIKIISEHLCSEPKLYNTREYKKLVMYGTEVFDWFVSNGCVQRKSLNLALPDIPNKYFRDFVRGVMDGDGCITRYIHTVKKPTKLNPTKTNSFPYLKCYICGVSKKFMTSLHERLTNEGFIHCFVKLNNDAGFFSNKKPPIYRIVFSGKKAKQFLDHIYYEGHILSMPRKFALVREPG